MATSPKRSVRITPEDLATNRVYIRYSGEAKIKLCHMAGAPWSDIDPDATLHPLQQETLGRKEREKIIHGASRLGKSVLGGCECLVEAMIPMSRLAVVATTYNHVSKEWQYLDRAMRNLFASTPQAFKRICYRHSQNYHDYEVSTIWGHEARGFSTDGDEGAGLLGSAFTRVVIGEGSNVSNQILEHKIMRAIDGALMKPAGGYDKETGYLSIYTTPKEFEGCSAAEWERVQKQTTRHPEKLHYGEVPFAETIWIREADILENPAYDRRVYEARRKTMSKAAFAEQYQGKMTFKSGRVYQEFQDATHLVTNPPDWKWHQGARFTIGIDTGAFFGASLLGLGRDNIMYVLGEVYTQKQAIYDSCAQVKDMVIEKLGSVFNTTDWGWLQSRIDTWYVDPASQHKLEIVNELDLDTIAIPQRDTGKWELIPTIDIVRGMFAEDRLFLIDDLPWTLDQIRKYTWKQTKSAVSKEPVIREPRKDYDHLMDSMRIGAVPLTLMGPLEEIPEVATVSELQDGRLRDRGWGALRREMNEAEHSQASPEAHLRRIGDYWS